MTRHFDVNPSCRVSELPIEFAGGFGGAPERASVTGRLHIQQILSGEPEQATERDEEPDIDDAEEHLAHELSDEMAAGHDDPTGSTESSRPYPG